MPSGTMKSWHVVGSSKDNFDTLKLTEDQIPQLGDKDVLVKCMFN